MRTHSRRARTAAAFIALGGLVTTLAACGGSGEGSDEAADGQASGELTIWHYEDPDSAMGQAWAKAIEVFEEENPGVTVNLERQSFESLRSNAKVILTGNTVPDVLEFNKGSDTGQLASLGLLTPLTDEAEARGWDQKLSSPSVQVLARYDEQGVPGSGDWYGIPNYGEYILWYYNQEYFTEHDLSVPTTRAELDALFETIKSEGTTPICGAAKDFPYIHTWFQAVLADAPSDWVDNYQLFRGPVDFDAAYWVDGTREAQKWAQEYTTPNVTGVTHEDMGANFLAGQCPLMTSGSWWFGRLKTEATFDWGTFAYPEQNLNQGSTGNLWTVPTNSTNKDLAYEFIDITLRPEIQAILDEQGGLSLAGDPAAITDERTKAFTEAFQALASENKLALYPDFPVPGFYDFMLSQSQAVANGSQSPEEIIQALADYYNNGRAEIENG